MPATVCRKHTARGWRVVWLPTCHVLPRLPLTGWQTGFGRHNSNVIAIGCLVSLSEWHVRPGPCAQGCGFTTHCAALCCGMAACWVHGSWQVTLAFQSLCMCVEGCPPSGHAAVLDQRTLVAWNWLHSRMHSHLGLLPHQLLPHLFLFLFQPAQCR